MAIQTILENVDESRLNIDDNTDNENRTDKRSPSYSQSSDDNWVDKSQQESASLSTLNEGDDLTEYWLCILNTFSHVILIVSILADAVGLSIYWSNTVGPNACMHLYWCEINIIGIYTAFQFVFAFLTLLWMQQIMIGCFCFNKDPTKETYSPLSLAGSIIRFLTLLILISCLTFALVGLGNEQIKSLSWNNMQNNNLKKEYRQEPFLTYELKPLTPAKRVYSWDASIDFYAILASMTNRIFNLEETKEFLDRYHCDINLPTTEGWLFKLFGYSSNNMACYPA